MDYRAHYSRLVDRAKIRGNIEKEYMERHHIIPKCMGGLHCNDNLIYLYPEEHFVAHLLLVKIYPCHQKLIYAAKMMTVSSDTNHRNNKLYGWLRKRFAKASSDRKRKPHTAETKLKMSLSRKGKPGHKATPEQKAKLSAIAKTRPLSDKAKDNLLKMQAANKGRIVSHETRKKMSISHDRKPRDVSLEARAIMSEKAKSRKHSIESNKKRSEKLLNRKHEFVTCPHCQKQGAKPAMTKWHFNACRLKV